MTTPQNNVDRIDRNYTSRQVVVTTNLTVNNGDLCYWDGTNYTITPITNATQITGTPPTAFFGMAMQANANLIYPGDADQVGVLMLVRGVVWVNSTAGQTYTPFQPVTIGADAQTVTSSGVSTSGSTFNVIGYVWTDTPITPRSNATPETQGGAAQVRIPIQLAPQHPVAAAI